MLGHIIYKYKLKVKLFWDISVLYPELILHISPFLCMGQHHLWRQKIPEDISRFIVIDNRMKFDYILPVNNFIDRSILLDSPFNFPEELFDLLLLRANPQHRETWLIEPIRSLSRKNQKLGKAS